MGNPFLDLSDLPRFAELKAVDIEAALDEVLASNRQTLNEVLQQAGTNQSASWAGLVQPLEEMDERLGRVWSPISHVNSVCDTPEWRDAFNSCLPKLSAYSTEMGQNRQLFEAYKTVREGAAELSATQRRVLDNALRDFHLSGVDLPDDKKARYKELMAELSDLNAKFSQNLLDATNAWSKSITDAKQLAGLPASALAMMAQAAEAKDEQGWRLSLEVPCYMAVVTYADDRQLRQEMYTAYATRASDQGDNAQQWDNGPLMAQILSRRAEVASLLDFDTYADYSLTTKMAPSVEKVLVFLRDLAAKARVAAEQELAELRQFAAEHCGIADMQAWDQAYVSEKLQQHKYALSQEDLRPYFPAPQAIQGLFAVAEKLFDVSIQATEQPSSWHDDVTFYSVHDKANGQLRGRFYLDPYARAHKRGGAWMDGCIDRMRKADGVQTPVAYLVCNFTPPVGDAPALLTHDEVITLFHEFGHGIHHLLTQVDEVSVSGINGVEWDAVELPSQFMENFCWERQALDMFARHHESGESLPAAMLERMLKAKNFQSAMQMLRQVEFSMFDLLIHSQANVDVQAVLEQVRDEVAVVRPPAFNRFANSFGHIFAGGYAAGYYSYKWAEVLSADAFAAFEEEGLFDAGAGTRFKQCVLEKGGSENALDLFVAFRGREPEVDALLRHSGLQ